MRNIAILENDTTGIVNFTDEEKAQFESSLNEITNGDYQNTVEAYQAEVKAEEEQKPTAQDENGQFVTAEPNKIAEVQKRAEEKKVEIAQNSEDNKATKFEVETPKKSEVTSFAQAKQISGSFTNVIKDFKNYSDKVIAEAAKTVARFGKSAQVYFGNLGGYNFITAIGKENNGWDTDQIKNLNLSFSQRKILNEEAEREEKLHLA